MSASSLIPFTSSETLPTNERVSTRGTRSVTYLSKKAYGQQFGLKGASLRKAHDQYRLSFGFSGNSEAASILASGRVIITKGTVNADGTKGTWSWLLASEIEAPVDPKVAANTLSAEELAVLLKGKGVSDEQLIAMLRSA